MPFRTRPLGCCGSRVAHFYALQWHRSGHVTCSVTAHEENAMLNMQQLKELLLQSLEHERGGVNIYEMAIRCAVSEDLRHQWSVYLEQTHTHVEILETVMRKLEIDPEQ